MRFILIYLISTISTTSSYISPNQIKNRLLPNNKKHVIKLPADSTFAELINRINTILLPTPTPPPPISTAATTHHAK